MTTIQTVTPEQIQQLRTEAGAAGDSEQVAQCDSALAYLAQSPQRTLCPSVIEGRALAGCVAAINAAEAMQEPDTAHGYTLRAWLDAAGRQDTASEYDLRLAWRNGEDPAEYARK